jgi:hypothetical protein
MAIGVAAGAGAAQLGLGYGLGIIAWVPDTESADPSVWLASLAWVLWLAGTSTVIGAICADRLSARGTGSDLVDPRADPGRGAQALDVAWRIVIALAAAIGALITVPLVAVPARAAHRADNFLPQVTAGGYAVVGVIVGLIAAIGALSSRAIAANAISSVAWMWALAVISVIDGVRASSQLGTAQLAVWDFTNGGGVIRNTIDWPSAVLMLGSALVIGGLAAWSASRRGDGRVGVAVSGVTGPLLVAAAYFLAAPRMLGVDAHQLSAFLIAPYAVLAGLAGSVLVAALGARAETIGGVKRADEEAALADWAQRLNSADLDAGPHDRDRKPGAGRDDPDDDDSDDLPDGYAPARAYTADPVSRAYASDYGDSEASGNVNKPSSTGTTRSTATGRSAVKEPLWPDQAKPAAKGRPGRRGNQNR